MEFIESRVFTRRLYQLLGGDAGEVLRGIQTDLQSHPQRGAIVAGLGGIRKARHRDPARGKGKRGGLRYLYLYLESRGRLHLLYLFDKSEEEDLNQGERAQLRSWAAEIKKQEAEPWQRRQK